MKHSNKVFIIFLIAVLCAQFSFIPAWAVSTDSQTLTNGTGTVNSDSKYSWNARGFSSTGELANKVNGQSFSGVSSITCQDIGGGQLQWTVNIQNININLGGNMVEQRGVRLVVRPQTSNVQNINYSCNANGSPLSGNYNNGDSLTIQDTTYGFPNFNITGQQLTFVTPTDFDSVQLTLSYNNTYGLFRNQEYQAIVINLTQYYLPKPMPQLSFKLTGDNLPSSVDVTIGSQSYSGLAVKNGTVQIPGGLDDDNYPFTISAPDYTMNPASGSVNVNNGTIYYNNQALPNNTLNVAVTKNQPPEPVDPGTGGGGTGTDPGKVKYVTDDEGTYPEHYTESPEANVRNADTREMNPDHENHKIAYDGATVGKWAEPTSRKDEFDVNLSIKGKDYVTESGLDVVFVLDNSYSMYRNFTDDYYVDYKNTKIWNLYKNVAAISDSIIKNSPNSRVGIVNFATLTVPTATARSVGQATGGYSVVDSTVYNYLSANYSPSQYRDFLNSINSEYKLLNYYGTRSNRLPLTRNMSEILASLPLIPRGDYYSFNNEGQNFGIQYDGETNTSAGVIQGAEILHPSADGRKKVMILVTDGMPTASFRLSNMNMPAPVLRNNLNFNPNIIQYLGQTPPPDTAPSERAILPALISTDTTFFVPGFSGESNAFYQTLKNGRTITMNNNLEPTRSMFDYYKRKYPDTRFISLLIGDENKQITDNITAGTYLKRLASPGRGNYYSSQSADSLAKNLDYIKKDIERTIVDGTVTDPMGENITLLPESGAFKSVGASKNLANGGYYLYNNLGQYLGTDGKIYDSNGQVVTGDSSLRGVQVTYDNGQIKISHLNLGDGEEIFLKYRVKVTEYNKFYQANKRTTLVPKPGETPLDFPIPSVRCPNQGGRPFVKVDGANGTKLKGAVFRITDEKGDKYLARKVINGFAVNRWMTEAELKKTENSGYQFIEVTSGSQGELKVDKLDYGSNGNLDAPATYYLKEIKAPAGYKLADKTFSFTIDSQSSQASGSNVQKLPNKSNEPIKTNFPFTGGNGTLMFLIVGLSAVTASLIALRRKLY